MRHLPLAGSTILDVGCGFGDFYDFLIDKKISFAAYAGIDIDPIILRKARQRNPGGVFEACSILNEIPPIKEPDLIVASGIAVVPFDDWDEYVHQILHKFYQITRVGFAMNFLSVLSQRPDPHSKYAQPWTILEWFQRNVDWKVLLVHDYKVNDFTIVHLK